MFKKKGSAFLPIKSASSVCSNLFENGDRQSLMSPMTELSVNLELSSMSTPRRRLSLNESENQTPERSCSVTESIESGIGTEAESPLLECPSFDSPTLENIRQRKLSSTSSHDSLSMRRRIMERSFSSPATTRKPLEPLNFKDSCSPFKSIDAEENHSDISLCEMSDEFPELEEVNFRMKMRKAHRSLSAPPDVFEAQNPNDFECISKASDDDGFFDEISKDTDLNIPHFSSSVPTNFMGLFAAPIMTKGTSSSCSDVSEEDKENLIPANQFKGNSLVKPIFQKPIGVPIRKSRSKSFSIKRDNPATDISPSPVSKKRRQRFIRSQSVYDINPVTEPLHKPFIVDTNTSSKTLQRSQSFDTHITKSPSVDITKLLDVDDKNLVGDRSREYSLPVTESKHPDLKGISPETLADVINGKYSDKVDDVHIIDCRYPYEYEGGHIKGAVNIFEKQEIHNAFMKVPKIDKNKRQVIIFHCEFSSKRGPAMCRFLRNKDRDTHAHCYPQLFYPEMYLLEGGYKEFFALQKDLCEPQTYREMVDPKFTKELKLFARRSKSWSEGDRSCVRRRTGLRY